MKSYKDLEKKLTPSEIAESYVFPASSREEDKKGKLEAFRQFRQRADAARTEKDKLISHLLQLKFQIEDYIEADTFNKLYHFGFFLQQYISRLSKQNKEFAAEIDVDPAELSQVINQHRAASEKLIIRLEIHSNKNFPALLWFKLIEKGKAHELAHDIQLRQREEKHVKHKLEFSI